ncbi:MAG TPA: S8 family serine peptidase [Tepidisphaeraceae bacterium]|jgi:subtilisin family serine protease|nr:S8 family serine peptidase [Tepidisphaeraceae bacterium]
MSFFTQHLPRKSPPAFESLESRLFLSVSTPQIPHGFSPLRWHGRDTYVRTAHWILKLDSAKGTPADQLLSIQKALTHANKNLHVRAHLGDDGLVLITSGTKAKYKNLLSSLKTVRGFKYLEPNFLLHAATIPNDSFFPNQDDLNNTAQSGGNFDADIDAPEAWDLTTGSPDVVVGVIDSGIDYTHPDLAANIWTNPFEIAGDGIDNDNNGYIDDIHGWDFANDDSDPMDDHGHGTHVSGTIAAVGNNGADVTGISWSSKLMALKILAANGFGELSAAIEALNYADDMAGRGVNIRVTNNSYGDPGFSLAMEDAITASGQAGLLFVAAAGNGGNDSIGDDNDTTPFYPASSDSPNIISVAATDNKDQRAGFSNYGATTVHIGAPGVSTWSTARGGGLTVLSGTSMATPHVVGVAALAFGISPRGTPYSVIRDAILNGGDQISALTGITTTGRRLNAFGALAQLPLTVINSTPAPDQAVSTAALDYQLIFSHPLTPESIEPTDLLVNDVPADSFTRLTPTTISFHFNTSPLTAEGLQTMQLADASITRQLDSAAVQPFSESFRYDTTPMQVLSSSIQRDQTEAHIDLQLNEPLAPSSLNLTDLQIDHGTITAAELLDPQQVRFTISGLDPEATLNISLPAGAFTDQFANPSLPHSATLQLDATGPTSLPTPLPSLSPLGGLLRGASASGLINDPADTDTFTLSLNAGQRLSLAVLGTDGLLPTFQLLDPQDQTLASVVTNSSIATTDDLLITTSGLYSIIVGETASTSGHYTLRASVNATLESESLAGPSNDTIPSGQPLDFVFLPLANGASRAAIAGQSDLPAGVLTTEMEPNDATFTANSGAKNFLPAPSNLFQMGIKGRILTTSDSDYFNLGDFQIGDTLTIALSGAGGPRGTLSDPFLELYRATPDGPLLVTDDDDSGPGIDALIHRFSIPDAGAYYARVRPYSDQTGTYDLALFLENIDTPPTTGSPQPTDSEPNDSTDTATDASSSWRTVQYISTTTGALANSDHDIVSYSLHQGDLVTVEVIPTGSLRPRLTLRDANNNPIAADDGSSRIPGRSAIIYTFIIPTTNTYYIDSFAKSGLGNYTSNLYLTSTTTPASPTPAPDLYSFSLEAGQQASLILDNSSPGSLQLQLQDPTSAIISTAIPTTISSQQAIATFTAPASGLYYARVAGDRFQDYTLLVTRDSAFDLGANDTIAQAQSLASASNALGYADSDDDWYSLPISTGNTIQLSTSTPGGPDNPLDPTLELYDPLGALIATDDNSATDGRNALITAKASISGDYRIHLTGAGAGEYLLSLTRFWSLPGTPGDDNLTIRENPQSHQTEIFLNTPLNDPPTYSLDPDLLSIIGLNGRGGSDQLILDGLDLQLAEPPTTTSLNLTLQNSAQLSLLGSPKLTSLDLQDSSRAALTSGHNVLRLSQIQISPDARLDLQDGSLILQADSATRLAMLNLLTDHIRSARSGGAWTGPGILTSTLGPDRLHTLGIMLNDAGGAPIKSVFAGQSVDDNSILLGYSLIGDTDLDNDIDADDYARIDAAFSSNLQNPAYADGDFDYSNSINSDDFFYIDRAFSSQ